MNALGYSALGFNSKRHYDTVDIDYARVKKLRVGNEPDTYLMPETKGNEGDVLTMGPGDAVLWEPPSSLQIFDTITFKPGVTTSGNVFGTWTECVDEIDKGCYNVVFDDSVVSPCIIDRQVTSAAGRLAFFPYRTVFGANVQVAILSGIQIHGLRQIQGPLNLTSDTSSGSNLVYVDGSLLELLEGATVTVGATYSAPVIELGTTSSMVLLMQEGAGVILPPGPALPFVHLLSGQSLIFVTILCTGPPSSDGFLAGDPGSNLTWIKDASAPTYAFPGYGGNPRSDFYVDLASNLSYDDSKAAPTTGQTLVQEVVDYLKAGNYPELRLLDPGTHALEWTTAPSANALFFKAQSTTPPNRPVLSLKQFDSPAPDFVIVGESTQGGKLWVNGTMQLGDFLDSPYVFPSRSGTAGQVLTANPLNPQFVEWATPTVATGASYATSYYLPTSISVTSWPVSTQSWQDFTYLQAATMTLAMSDGNWTALNGGLQYNGIPTIRVDVSVTLAAASQSGTYTRSWAISKNAVRQAESMMEGVLSDTSNNYPSQFLTLFSVMNVSTGDIISAQVFNTDTNTTGVLVRNVTYKVVQVF